MQLRRLNCAAIECAQATGRSTMRDGLESILLAQKQSRSGYWAGIDPCAATDCTQLSLETVQCESPNVRSVTCDRCYVHTAGPRVQSNEVTGLDCRRFEQPSLQ